MKMKYVTAILLYASQCIFANAQPEVPPSDDYGPSTYEIRCENLPLQVVLEHYSSITDCKIDIAPGVNTTFTFSSGQNLTRDEVVELIRNELAKQRIHLVQKDDGTLRAEWIP